MRRSTKWLVGYSLAGLWLLSMVGIFYYHRCRFELEEQLKQNIIDKARLGALPLFQGLMRDDTVTSEELNSISDITKDDRIVFLVYLNKNRDVRWFKESKMIGRHFDDFIKEWPLRTNAIDLAFSSKSPIVLGVPDQPLFDIAIPLAVRGDILAMLDMQVSHSGIDDIAVRKVVRQGPTALAILVLVGFIGFRFFRSTERPLNVIAPQ